MLIVSTAWPVGTEKFQPFHSTEQGHQNQDTFRFEHHKTSTESNTYESNKDSKNTPHFTTEAANVTDILTSLTTVLPLYPELQSVIIESLSGSSIGK